MKRGQRIAVEILGPPFVATVGYVMLALIRTGQAKDIGAGFIVVLVYSYFFAALPSLAFALVMELSFASGMKVQSWQTVLVASAAGTLSGGAIALTMIGSFTDKDGLFSTLLAIGLATGGLIGIVIRTFPPRQVG
jgi:hypothetical protein